MSWSLEDLKYILKNIFSITFSNDNQQRRNMYFEACHCTKNLIFFLQIFWEDSLSKTVALKYNLSCIIRKGDISFSQKYDFDLYTQKKRSSFSKKPVEIWCVLQMFWKDGLSQKVAQEYDPFCNMWKYNISFFWKMWKIYFF